MTPNDLLERRAERGTPRGAASVWAGAQHQLHSTERSGARTSVWGFRVALAASAVLLVLVAIRSQSFDRGETVNVATPAAEDSEVMSNLPAPLLITGMTLDQVHEPMGSLPESATTFNSGDTPDVVSTRVYARAVDPLDGPVLGIDTLVGGGFSPWSANLSEAELRSLTDGVVRDGDSWGLADAGALIEIDQFEHDPMKMVIDGWQLNFVDGGETATVQAEPDGTVWLWMSRMLRYGPVDEQTTASSIEILGHDGVLLGDGAFWEADGFVYRITAGEVRGDTHYGTPVEPVLDRLVLGDRSDWDAAVKRAKTPSFRETATYTVSLAAAAAWIVASLVLMVRHPRRVLAIAACGLAGFVIWWALAPSLWFVVVLLAIPMAEFWRNMSAQPPTSPQT